MGLAEGIIDDTCLVCFVSLDFDKGGRMDTTCEQ